MGGLGMFLSGWIEVDYSADLWAAIARGCFDYVNENISPGHFPRPKKLKGKKRVFGQLFCVKKQTSLVSIRESMEEEGCHMANIFELLALPEIEGFPVAAMGSVWTGPHGQKFVPF